MKALSFNEAVVVELFACGWNAQHIATITNSSIEMVKLSLHRSKRKLGIKSTTKLLYYWHCDLFKLGLLELKLLPILKVPKGIM